VGVITLNHKTTAHAKVHHECASIFGNDRELLAAASDRFHLRAVEERSAHGEVIIAALPTPPTPPTCPELSWRADDVGARHLSHMERVAADGPLKCASNALDFRQFRHGAHLYSTRTARGDTHGRIDVITAPRERPDRGGGCRARRASDHSRGARACGGGSGRGAGATAARDPLWRTCAGRGRAGAGQDADHLEPREDALARLLAHPVHARPHALRRDGIRSDPGGPNVGIAVAAVRARSDLRQCGARG